MTAIDDLLHAIGRTPSADVIGGVAVTIARRAGLDAEALVAPSLLEVADDAVVGDLPVSVELLGSLHEHGQATATRRRRGSHYTPDDVARRLVQVACPGGPVGRVCDPAVGGGAFLLAAADLLARTGLPRAAIVTERLWGADIDPLAVDVTRTALSLWAGAPCPPDRVVVADTLRHPPPWSHRFDLVVGNPPFLSPLARDTAPSAEARQVLRERFGDAFGPYVDSSALFLLVGLGLLEADGHMVLVQPLSFLAARDAGEVRRRLLEQTCLRGLWVATERVFGAAVEVCAPIVERSRRLGPVTRYQGRAVVRAGTAPAPSSPGELASLAAPLVGIPPARPSASTTLGERAEVMAGFRDEYYAIAAATREGGPGPRVVTAGRIGPLRLDPDRRPVRVQRRDYDDPRVDLAVLRRSGAKVAAWADRLLVPKVLVATQTPVIEVVADPDGTLMPLTPVLAVIPATRPRVGSGRTAVGPEHQRLGRRPHVGHRSPSWGHQAGRPRGPSAPWPRRSGSVEQCGPAGPPGAGGGGRRPVAQPSHPDRLRRRPDPGCLGAGRRRVVAAAGGPRRSGCRLASRPLAWSSGNTTKRHHERRRILAASGNLGRTPKVPARFGGDVAFRQRTV